MLLHDPHAAEQQPAERMRRQQSDLKAYTGGLAAQIAWQLHVRRPQTQTLQRQAKARRRRRTSCG